jgi:signal transduction histidine kinase
MTSNHASHDTSLLRELGQAISRAPSIEALVATLHRGLCCIGAVKETRVVALESPGVWKEWIAGTETTGVRIHRGLPAPKSNGTTEYFDDQNRESGFLWISGRDGVLADVVKILGPHVHTATLWHTGIRRTRHLNAQERELSQASLRARDEERRVIARELHDDLGQSLVSIRLSMKWVEGIVRRTPGMEEACNELASTCEMIGGILSKIRDVSHTLYPNILDTLGLDAAIRELALTSTKRSGIETVCSQSGETIAVPKDAAVALYRSCQECLSNAIRHSGATRISVALDYRASEVHVTVEDNGKGFDPRLVHSPGERLMGNGFWSIRQRVMDLGGAFRVSTAKGQGTVVEVIVPVEVSKD